MDIATIEADIKQRIDNAKTHLEQFVNDHVAPLHVALGELAGEVEKAKTSPIVSEVEGLLPPEVAAAVKLIENLLISATQATVPEAPAAPVEQAAAPALPVDPAVPVPTA